MRRCGVPRQAGEGRRRRKGRVEGNSVAGGVWSGVAAGLALAVLGLGAASLMGPQPSGHVPPSPPLVEPPGAATGDLGEGRGPAAVPAPTEGPSRMEGVALGSADPAPSAPLASETDPAGSPEASLPDLTMPQPGTDEVSPVRPAAAGTPATAASPPAMPAPESEALPAASAAVARSLPLAPVTPAAPASETPAAGSLIASREAEVVAGPSPSLDVPAATAPSAALAMRTVEPPQAPVAGGTDRIASAASEGTAPAHPPLAEAAGPEIVAASPPTLPAADAAPSVPASATPVALAPPPAPPPARPVRALGPAEALAALDGPAPWSPSREPPAEPAAVEEDRPAASAAMAAPPPPVPPPSATPPEEADPIAEGPAPVVRPPVRRPPAVSAPETAEAAAVPEVFPDDPRALIRHAAPFEAPGDGRPLLSLVLLDDPALAGAEAAVAALPFPVSVALDPAAEGAAERMAAFRAAGVEILALAALPTGARPVDAAVAYEGILATLPEAVAVLDLGAGGLGSGSAAAPQALGRLARDGRGAVLAEAGLGTALRAAAQAGVPAAALMRDLDGAGQDGRVIRRFLDDAARRAGQEGNVVLLARLRPETLSALALWAGARRAQEVAVAPVSALLRAAEEGVSP
jgi:polysaccharide deacetylase 2 family uncharacterized protein YibQ